MSLFFAVYIKFGRLHGPIFKIMNRFRLIIIVTHLHKQSHKEFSQEQKLKKTNAIICIPKFFIFSFIEYIDKIMAIHT